MEKWKNDHELSFIRKEEERGVDSINPFFQKISAEENYSEKNITILPKIKNRFNKNHNLKFPVTSLNQLKLRTFCKQAQRQYVLPNQMTLSQTKFNSLLVQYALSHLEIVNWNIPYEETKKYMHVMLPEWLYEDIGGPYGLAINKKISERKTVYYLIHSMIKWLERDGEFEQIFKQL